VCSCVILLRRITAVDANDLYDFMVIDMQQRDAGKSHYFVALSPVQTCNLLPCNSLPVWASCIVWATSCSKWNMFNIAQLVARCDFLLLKQATLLPPATAGHKSTASYCRQQVACLDGALVSYHIILCILAIGRRIHGSRDGVYKNKANDLE